MSATASTVWGDAGQGLPKWAGASPSCLTLSRVTLYPVRMRRSSEPFAALPPCALVAIVLSSCGGPADDTSGVHRWDPAPTVVLVTVDSLRADFLGEREEGWDTAPFLRSLFDEGVLLPHVQAARNITGPALTSILTGTYPRDHKIRVNDAEAPVFPLLSERFQAAGYRTLGFSANLCMLLDSGFDQTGCTFDLPGSEAGWEATRDETNRADLSRAIRKLDPDEPVFAWLHLNQVHNPYILEQAWYDRFHPEPYGGELDVTSVNDIVDIELGRDDVTEEDLRHLRAVYASEVRAMDERVRAFVSDLQDAGRWDDAIFVFGADHGEELVDHFNYFGHGCSPYQPVARLVFSVRAPGRLPAGLTLHGWVSQTDIAPTLVDVASAFDWTGFRAGRSLVDEMLAGEFDEQPAFFERGVETASLAWKGHRLILSGVRGYDQCAPFSQDEAMFPSEPCELYDLEADPWERTNLAEDPAHSALRADLTDRVCDWVEERPWVETDEMMASNTLVQTCAAR